MLDLEVRGGTSCGLASWALRAACLAAWKIDPAPATTHLTIRYKKIRRKQRRLNRGSLMLLWYLWFEIRCP